MACVKYQRCAVRFIKIRSRRVDTDFLSIWPDSFFDNAILPRESGIPGHAPALAYLRLIQLVRTRIYIFIYYLIKIISRRSFDQLRNGGHRPTAICVSRSTRGGCVLGSFRDTAKTMENIYIGTRLPSRLGIKNIPAYTCRREAYGAECTRALLRRCHDFTTFECDLGRGTFTFTALRRSNALARNTATELRDIHGARHIVTGDGGGALLARPWTAVVRGWTEFQISGNNRSRT